MKVLIVRIGAMGDVLHALPAVASLRIAHPDWTIHWAVEPRWGAMLAGGGFASTLVLDEVIPVRTREWNTRPFSLATLRDVLALRKRLDGERYDVCVDLQGTIRSAVVGRMAGAARFIGPEEPREGPAMHLYGETVNTKSTHVVEEAFEILERGVGSGLLRRSGEAWMISPVVEYEAWAKSLAGSGGRGVVVIAPTAGWPSKEWPVEKFGELAWRLANEGWKVLINTGPEGVVTAEGMVVASQGRATAVRCTLPELASLLRRASLFVGGDTGPMHLADTLGVPVVALFGPTDPARTGPRGRLTRVLRDAGSVTDHRRYKTTEAGLARITVEEVFQAAMELGQGVMTK